MQQVDTPHRLPTQNSAAAHHDYKYQEKATTPTLEVGINNSRLPQNWTIQYM